MTVTKHRPLEWEVRVHTDDFRRAYFVNVVGPASVGGTLRMPGDLKDVK